LKGSKSVFANQNIEEGGRMLRRITIAFLSLCLVVLPVLAAAQDVSEVMTQAQIDAAMDSNGFIWMGCGFLFGIFAVGAAYIISPNPPAARLVGKSPEYVSMYALAYRQKSRAIRVTNSIIGCLAGGVVTAIIIAQTRSSD
jgi:hypothetical protein